MMSSTSHQDQTPEAPADPAEILNEASAGNIDPGLLSQLTDLSREQIIVFEEHWAHLPLDIRRDIVLRLNELSLDELALDFSRVFMSLVCDSDETVRARAVNGLWEETSSSFLQRLSHLAFNDDSAAVQQAVAERLGTYCFEAEVDMLDEDDVRCTREALLHLLDHGKTWMVRRRAMESAAFMTTEPRVRQAILDAYESDFEQEQAGALFAMGRQLRDEWYPIILRELDNEDPDIRCEAARAAAEYGDDSALDPLQKLVDDEDEEIQAVAIMGIGQIGGKKGIDVLRFLETQIKDERRQELIEEALEEAIFMQEAGELGL
jgi:hypothetical protein